MLGWSRSHMIYEQLHKRFLELVSPSKPNDWDVEETLVELEDLGERHQKLLLEAIPTVWPISHSLSFSFLKEGARRAHALDRQRLAEWLRRILHAYEEGGLKKARAYMIDSAGELERGAWKEGGISLANHRTRLQAFARGISGLDVLLQEGRTAYTDTETIFLPEQADFFSDAPRSMLYYKLLIVLQCLFIRQGSFGRHRFSAIPGNEGHEKNSVIPRAAGYFQQFNKPLYARSIYQLAELFLAFEYFQHNYPGLLRETEDVRYKLYLGRSDMDTAGAGELDSLLLAAILPEHRQAGSLPIVVPSRETLRTDPNQFFLSLYYRMEETALDTLFDFSPFMDRFHFDEVERKRERRIEENESEFVSQLGKLFQREGAEVSETLPPDFSIDQADSALVRAGDEDVSEEGAHACIVVNNSPLELPEELEQLISRLEMDLGRLPEGLVSAAFGAAGHGRPTGGGAKDGGQSPMGEFLPYDEWDYRRHGYRRNWCSLRERELAGVASDFYDRTVEKYRGSLLKIRRQFEMMRTEEHFVRRRRHGDDLDLDAVIDSLGDQRAGLSPSEKLFVRLVRDERSISTCFLVDMSNSTEGWIGRAIKETLVLFCEALEKVGDFYGIYGFSGMRRMRSEVYTIKDMGRAYDDLVKQRIAAITPKEYTRMGPPVRHMTQKLKTAETRSRLLLILSDGKPEDYDDYRGEYAIEDTRKALAEARGRGIHPYCIAIDREAHDYLDHLFGRSGYTYINNIEQLPARLPEIYRLLTK